MIPLGNWQDEMDDLKSENFDLQEAVGTLEDEVDRLTDELENAKKALQIASKEREALREENVYHLNTRQAYQVRLADALGRPTLYPTLRDLLDEVRAVRERAEKAEAKIREYDAETWTDHDGTVRPIMGTPQELCRRLYDENERAGREKMRADRAEQRAGIAEGRASVVESSTAAYRQSALAEMAQLRNLLGDQGKRLTDERDRWRDQATANGTRAVTAERRAERAEREAGIWQSSFLSLEHAYGELQKRSNSWLEVAKNLVRARNMWVDIADEHLNGQIEAENERFELKAALRVLGA